MERMFRKGRQHFDTTTRPSHVTFDDGNNQRLNLPWMHYIQTRWDHGDQDCVKVLIGDWLVLITGHNLGPLFTAIEEHELIRIRAQPDLMRDPEHADDSFATEIRFLSAPDKKSRGNGQSELDLGLD
jgi:hypothetical protein